MQHPIRKAPSSDNRSGDTDVSLYELVRKLQSSLLRETVAKKSIIVNDIDESIHVQANEHLLAFIIGSMMSNAVFSTVNTCIHVDAVKKDEGFQIRVRNNGVFIYSSLMHSLGNIVDAARKINGRISLADDNRSISVILDMVSKNAA
jgi:C4-dicarboxylate-specific signal transduction histidine kinase